MNHFLQRASLSVFRRSKTSFSTSVTTVMVKELRERTGAPMMDCKKALGASDVNGDMAKAVDWLRAKGIARAANQGDRQALEGIIASFVNSANGNVSFVEINSETGE